MKRFVLALGAGLLAIAMATPTFAADLPRPAYKAPYKNPVYVAPFSWTGLYVGINGGYGWGKTNWTFAGIGSSGDFNTKGAFVGGTVGYNLQLSSYVIGAEGDFDASWIKGNNAVFCVAPGCETRNQWLSTGRVRLGYAWDRWLPFLTGGAAFGSIKMTPGPNPTDTKTALGWTAGGGIEYAFMNEWSVKAEYLYVDLGKVTCAAAACGVDTDVTFKSNLVRLGVNYRF